MKLKLSLVFLSLFVSFILCSGESFALFGGGKTKTTVTSTTTPGASSSTPTTKTSQSTTVTTTKKCKKKKCSSTSSTAVTDVTTGTLPGDSSGMNFSCTKTVTDGMSSIQNSVMNVPSKFIEKYVDQVFSVAGMSIGVGSLVSSAMGVLNTRVDDMCNRMVPLIVNPSGQEASSKTEMDSIVGTNSSYVADLQSIADEMTALTSSVSSGTLTASEGQDVLDQFTDLQNEQVGIIKDMNDDMTELADQHAAASSNAPASPAKAPSSAPKACDTQVTYADIANPTAAEIVSAGSHLACFRNSTGSCCYDSCDATPPLSAKAAVIDAFAHCYELNSGAGYCCFN